ncbi:MAG: nitroreductase family protein [Endomicrobia bacterium]|nr:nitroreductase family protein [Endomicrobiia bacterium]MCX7940445.1 nitroreductase family protein [Endomicrobiia bacterium]MDW8055862.1 nitroreductase family protein [Elusimicrobiota bacterium]
MDGITMIETRRSIRRYVKKQIPDEIVKKIINCARLAPTANNLQPWLFVVIKDTKLKQQISDIADHGKFIKDADCCIAVFCEDTKYYLEDGSAATQNILLAAWYFGIGSCWVAGDKKPYAEKVREVLGVKDKYKLVSLISLGYPDEEELKKIQNIKKKSVEEVLIIK